MTDALQVPDYVRFNRVEGDFVLVDLRKGLYFSLDGVASKIWEVLVGGGSPTDAVHAITNEYEASGLDVQQDVSELVETWKSKGLLIPV